jgi:hypothetical protein
MHRLRNPSSHTLGLTCAFDSIMHCARRRLIAEASSLQPASGTSTNGQNRVISIFAPPRWPLAPRLEAIQLAPDVAPQRTGAWHYLQSEMTTRRRGKPWDGFQDQIHERRLHDVVLHRPEPPTDHRCRRYDTHLSRVLSQERRMKSQ